MIRDSQPDDEGYFENMTRIIFQGGLNWKIIEKKWSNFRRAFKNFSIDDVALFDNPDVERLMQDSGIVRNMAKIIATIKNAKEFQKIIHEYGSFQKYIDSLDKTNNYTSVIEEFSKKFSRLGPSTARIFLYSVGENIKHEM